MGKSLGASSVEGNVARLRSAQDRYLPRMIELCASAHPHYSRLFRERGLSPDDFRSVEDLRKLPLLLKAEYVQDPESFRLDLKGFRELPTEEKVLADVIYTAGSTATPTPFYDTVHDRLARAHLLSRAAEIAGIGPGDTVMNLFPISALPHQGSVNASWGAMASGAKLLWGMTGRRYEGFPVHRRMDDAIDMIEQERATVLWGITTYVRKVVLRAQELGKDFGSVRLAMVMGESCPPAGREDIRARLQALGSGAVTVNNGYGFTEMLGPAVECVELGGTHLAVPDQFYFEVVDPETERPLPDGEEGMLVISHLNRRGTVLLRYVVGDVVALTHETCPHCGRREPRFLGSPYRADGITKIKGTMVNPAALQEELSGLFGRGAAEYQVVVSREDPDDPLSPDAMTVRVACAAEDRERLAQEAAELVVRAVEITPAVELLDRDAFSEITRDYKFERFVDAR